MKIAVIDGQGGGMGKAMVERLRAALGNRVEIVALGTNTLATSAMLRAGADEGATGENAVIVNVPRVQLVIGSVGIISANSMLGELTPRMALAISSCDAEKILIPINRCGLYVAGTAHHTVPECMEDAVAAVRERIGANHPEKG